MVEAGGSFATDRNLQSALEELRHSTLAILGPAILAMGWLWVFYGFMSRGIVSGRDLPGIFVIVAMASVLLLRRRHHALACWVLVMSLVIAQALAAWQYPRMITVAFGVVGVIAVNALLGAWQAALTAALLWMAGALALSYRLEAPQGEAWTTLMLYALSAGASWLGGRSLQMAVSWSLTGWQQAHDALDEARERRGELYRALRALEEATYRIERMNDELVIARSEAEAARAMKAQFVATVSHEIRGPLNLILGFSRLMALSPERYRTPLPADYRADIATIYRSSQHLASLVDDILDLSQMEAERLPLVRERVDLERDVVLEAVDIVRPLAEREGLSLTVDLAGDLPTLLVDQVRLRQVLLNLLTNAIRFTETGGIAVRSRLEAEQVVVSVQDTGPGIPEEEVPEIFRTFHRLSTADRATAEKGSGLGLSISKQLVELHGGDIWVESEVGVGTTVHFSLPLPGTATPASTIRRASTDDRKSAKENLFIIHDDPALVRTLGRYLEGYRVIGIPDRNEVASLTEELHPRGIITTPELAPSVDAELATLPYDVPVITARLPRVADALCRGRVMSYLVKPVSAETVAAIMSRVYRDGELTVLLVDDDPDASRLLEMMLLAIPHPYRILKAYDGEQALEMMEEPPDIVFLDLIMPHMGGEEVIARMRADERLVEVPVVILSARDWSEDAIMVDLPITVERRRPVKLAKMAGCLLATLQAVSPNYLQPAPVPASAPVSPR